MTYILFSYAFVDRTDVQCSDLNNIFVYIYIYIYPLVYLVLSS